MSAEYCGAPSRERCNRFGLLSSVGSWPSVDAPAPGSASPRRYHAVVLIVARQVQAKNKEAATLRTMIGLLTVLLRIAECCSADGTEMLESYLMERWNYRKKGGP